MKRFSKVVLIVFGFCLAVSAQTAEKSKYIGLKYTNGDVLPDKIKDEGGGLLTDPYKKVKQYGVAQVSQGKNRMLWLEYEYARTEDDKRPKWEVKDVLTLPNFAKDDSIIFATGTCEINGKTDEKMIVFARFLPKSLTYSVKRAWLANLETEKFEEIPVKGIKCVYDAP